jgi:hypothetical protein
MRYPLWGADDGFRTVTRLPGRTGSPRVMGGADAVHQREDGNSFWNERPPDGRRSVPVLAHRHGSVIDPADAELAWRV